MEPTAKQVSASTVVFWAIAVIAAIALVANLVNDQLSGDEALGQTAENQGADQASTNSEQDVSGEWTAMSEANQIRWCLSAVEAASSEPWESVHEKWERRDEFFGTGREYQFWWSVHDSECPELLARFQIFLEAVTRRTEQ